MRIMTPIVNDPPIKFTCAVCGSPINPFAKGLPDLMGEFSATCKMCQKPVCNKHFDKKSGFCDKCSNKGSDWCDTGIPSIPDMF